MVGVTDSDAANITDVDSAPVGGGVAVGSAEDQCAGGHSRAVALEDNVICPREGAAAIEPDMDLKLCFIRINVVVIISVDKAVPAAMPIRAAIAPILSRADSNS